MDYIKEKINDFFKYRFLLYNLISREIKVKYRRSILGILWSVLNPLFTMIVISMVFSRIFRFNVENFNVYFLTGSVIFSFMSDATTSSISSIIGSGALIKKVYMPKYIFPLEKTTFALVNLGFSLIAVLIVILFSSVKVGFSALLFTVPILYCYVFSLGISLALAALTVRFRDIQHLYSVIITTWMYLTPVIYPASAIEGKLFKVMKFNPMYYYVTYFREVIMYNHVPDFNFNLICIGFSLSSLIIGTIIFKKKQKTFILYI